MHSFGLLRQFLFGPFLFGPFLFGPFLFGPFLFAMFLSRGFSLHSKTLSRPIHQVTNQVTNQVTHRFTNQVTHRFTNQVTHRFTTRFLHMRKTTPFQDNDDTYASKTSRKNKNTKGKEGPASQPLYKPRTQNQKTYLSHLLDPNTPIVFGIGPAGCGKTLFACITAIQALKAGTIQKVILTRPIVPVEEEELGFLPGTLVKKMDPWTRPLFDIFLEHYKQHELDFMISSGIIEISPLAYMRGRTFKRAFVIADEMQNSSPTQMLMLATRIGEGSKMVITGDLKQSDRCANNGLLDFIQRYGAFCEVSKDCDDGLGIELVHMKAEDIQRSPIVSKILALYEERNERDEREDKTPSSSPPDLSKIIKEKNKEVSPFDLSKVIEEKKHSMTNFTTAYNISLIRQVENRKDENRKDEGLPSGNLNEDAALFPLDREPKNGDGEVAPYRRGW
jgi:phosphate starvation-inducible PhoH-like protein